MRIGRGAGALALAALTLGGCSSSGQHSAAPSVEVSVNACGQGWDATQAGPVSLRLRNTDSRSGEAQVIAPATGAVYADVEPFGPGTTRELELELEPGSYAIRCVMEDEAAVTSRPVTLAGAHFSGGTPGVVPVSQAELLAQAQRYQAYVRGQLPVLGRLVDRLGTALDDRGQAERAWLAAHLEYEGLGAAYGAFGDFDDQINGLPYGLPRGTRDPAWTGFHRIEFSLWHGASATELTPQVTALEHAVRALQQHFAEAQIDPLTLTLRAHEITENALQFSLTRKDDFGSHTSLQTVGANLAGTRTVLDILGELVPNRAAIYEALAKAQHLTASADLAVRSEREQVDSAVSELTELLAPVAAQLEPRRTS